MAVVVYEDPEKGSTSTWITAFTFAVITALTCSCLFILLMMEKRKKKVHKLTAMFCFGSATASLGYAFAYGPRLRGGCMDTTIIAISCLTHHPHITLYSIGELLIIFSMLLMGIDFFVVTMPTVWKLRIDNSRINHLILATIIPCSLNVLTCWLSTLQRGDVAVSSCCYHEDVVPVQYYLIYYGFISFLGYTSVLLSIVAVVVLKMKKPSSSAVREVQVRRNIVVMKQTFAIVIFTFFVQTVPCTAAVVIVANGMDRSFLQYAWIVCIVSYSVYAFYSMCRFRSLRRRLKLLFVCETEQTSVEQMINDQRTPCSQRSPRLPVILVRQAVTR